MSTYYISFTNKETEVCGGEQLIQDHTAGQSKTRIQHSGWETHTLENSEDFKSEKEKPNLGIGLAHQAPAEVLIVYLISWLKPGFSHGPGG